MKRLFGACLILICLSFAFSVRAQSGTTKTGAPTVKKNQRTEPPVKPQPTPNAEETEEAKADDAATSDENGQTDATAETDEEVLRVETSLVTVPVAVFDKNGRFIAGLKQEDFQIAENGKPQQIQYFAGSEAPATIALLLDVSLSASFKIEDIQRAAWTFVNQLNKNDRVMIISFAREVNVHCQPTSDREVLKKAINQTKFEQGTSLYETVAEAMNRIEKISGRRAIVIFTDGVDTTSRKSNDLRNLRQAQKLDALVYSIRYNTYENVQQILRQPPTTAPPSQIPGGTNSPFPFPQTVPQRPMTIPGTNIPINIPQRRTNEPTQQEDEQIAITGSGTTRTEYRKGQEYLQKMADYTNAKLFEADTLGGLDAAFTNIINDLRQQYSLGYYPENTDKTGEKRKIKVSVSREKSKVRARESYIVGEKQSKKKKSEN